jgi:hypothetical protein
VTGGRDAMQADTDDAETCAILRSLGIDDPWPTRFDARDVRDAWLRHTRVVLTTFSRLPPTIRRVAGSCRIGSSSFTR